MKKILVLILTLLASAFATNNMNCATYCCPKGFRYITATDPKNVECLGGICTTSTCCYAPTCASSVGYWGNCKNRTAYEGLKRNADEIQCPDNLCNERLCCKSV
jgi:hypothetical protein